MNFAPLYNRIKVFTVGALIVIMYLLFSSDLRMGLNFQIETRPSFQFAEFLVIPLIGITLALIPFKLKDLRLKVPVADLLIVLFIAHAYLQAFGAEDVLHSISRAKDFFIATFIYFFVKYSPLKLRHLRYLKASIVAISVAWSVIGILQWLGLDKDFGGDAYKLFLASQALYTKFVFEGDTFKTFAHGLYLFPQNFIYYLVYPFFLTASYVKRSKLMAIPTAVVFVAMIGTISKTFIIIVLLCLLYYVLYFLYRNSLFSKVNVVALAIMGLLVIVCIKDLNYLKSATASFLWRIDQWEDSFYMFYDIPSLFIFGHGTERMADYYSRYNYPNPHNMVLYFSMEYGLIGFSLFASFLYVAFKDAGNYLKGTDHPDNHTIMMLNRGLLFIVGMGIVDDIFVQTQLTFLFMFYLGLLGRYINAATQEITAVAPPTDADRALAAAARPASVHTGLQ